jgi:hypothetical protein
LNDVSILLPLAGNSAPKLLPKPSDRGERGELLPARLLDRIGRLNSFEDPEATLAKLRAVAIRIDPCFPGDSGACRAQVRLVWQPVSSFEGVGATTDDAALHTFHDLPPAEFEALVGELSGLRSRARARLASLPLSVHPVIAREGLEGAYFTALKRILLRHAGSSNLSRITFMKLAGGGSVWTFGGFDVAKDGTLIAMTIPRVGAKVRQAFVNGARAGDTEFFSTQLAPSPQGNPSVNLISKDSKLVKAGARPEEIVEEVVAARAIENPRLVPTPSMDCVSCHVAQSARIWAIRAFPDLRLETEHRESAYRNERHPLENTSRVPDFTANLRGFGYFGDEPAISRRAIHESAEVADALNARFR